MKKLISESRVPPGGIVRYRDPDTGKVFEHPYFIRVKNLAREHRLDSGLPVPTDWDQQFVDVICAEQPNACEDAPTFAERVVTFAKSTAKWAASGFATVGQEGYDIRIAICKDGCPHFRGERSGWKISCAKCGCARKKLFLATEHCPIGKW